MSRAEWALVAAGFLGFGLVALGRYALGERWRAGAGALLAAVALIVLAVLAQRKPPR
jgi:hypothetical protein